jgi:PAS domain S-box-containing protein
MFESAAVGIALVTPGGRFMRVNDRLCEILGWSRDELVGRDLLDLIHPEDHDRQQALLGEVVAGEIDSYQVEQRYVGRHGGVIWALVTVGSERDLSGACEYLVSVIEDITDRKSAEADLRSALTAKDEFLGLISHELRTPLTVVYGMSRMLTRRDLRPEKVAAVAADIADSAEYLTGLVESMLLLGRLDRHESHQLREPVLLHHVAERVVERQRSQHPGRRVDLRIESREGLVEVQPSWIERVIENLVGNAAKYSPPDRPITVVVAAGEGREAVLRVLDEGSGLDEDEVDRLFDAFYRSQATIRIAPGAGLGLAVAKRIVDLLGGHIWARGRPGGGAEFGFALPLHEEGSD